MASKDGSCSSRPPLNLLFILLNFRLATRVSASFRPKPPFRVAVSLTRLPPTFPGRLSPGACLLRTLPAGFPAANLQTPSHQRWIPISLTLLQMPESLASQGWSGQRFWKHLAQNEAMTKLSARLVPSLPLDFLLPRSSSGSSGAGPVLRCRHPSPPPRSLRPS